MKRCYIKAYLEYKTHRKKELNLFLIKSLKKDNFLKTSGLTYGLYKRLFCIITGRARSVHFLFKVARMEIKFLMSVQLLQGVRKSNW